MAGPSFLKVIDEQNTLRIPKYGGQNLARWCFRLWSLWTAFTNSCPLSWMPIWLWSEVVDPFFIHCHLLTQKLLLKQLQTTLWIVDALLFLIDWEQTWHPFWIQLSHWQIFMQNGEYTAFWYLQFLWYLTQLQFTIGHNEFVEFFGVCWNSAEFGRPKCSASFVSVRPHLKSAYHNLTVVSDGAECE